MAHCARRAGGGLAPAAAAAAARTLEPAGVSSQHRQPWRPRRPRRQGPASSAAPLAHRWADAAAVPEEASRGQSTRIPESGQRGAKSWQREARPGAKGPGASGPAGTLKAARPGLRGLQFRGAPGAQPQQLQHLRVCRGPCAAGEGVLRNFVGDVGEPAGERCRGSSRPRDKEQRETGRLWRRPRGGQSLEAARRKQPGSPRASLPRSETKGRVLAASCTLLLRRRAPLAVPEAGPCAMPSTPRAPGPLLLGCGPGAAV